MNPLSSSALRQIRSSFRTSKQHIELPEVSLVADKHATALFNVAGMQPLIPYLMGKEHPLGKRLFDIQKCIRTVDIAEVGDASHLTFFEMMGNRSLGDYFKKEAVTWSWEFLTQHLGINPRNIAVTVFEGDNHAPRDQETAAYWQECFEKAGVPVRISYLSADHNRRSPGPVGPCGPDTEIFYRVGESAFPSDESTVAREENNWLEIRNNVFMEYYRDESGMLSKLNKQNVDTGMGFERMCQVLQGKDSVYDTDLFKNALQTLEKHTELAATSSPRRFRIIADHARTAFMLINDGLIPSNIAAGYVLRMIIRRMIYNAVLLQPKLGASSPMDNLLADLLQDFQHLRKFNYQEILRVLRDEHTLFGHTLQSGKKILEGMMEKQLAEGKKQIEGSQLFLLYDSFGFPIELTKEITQEKGLQIDEEGFQSALAAAKEKSRQATKEMFKKGTDWSKYLEGIPQTEFIGYSAFSSDHSTLLKTINLPDGQQALIFDKTPFYPEMGGQMGDVGEVTLEDGEVKKVNNVQKFAGVILHFIGA